MAWRENFNKIFTRPSASLSYFWPFLSTCQEFRESILRKSLLLCWKIWGLSFLDCAKRFNFRLCFERLFCRNAHYLSAQVKSPLPKKWCNMNRTNIEAFKYRNFSYKKETITFWLTQACFANTWKILNFVIFILSKSDYINLTGTSIDFCCR